LHVFWSIWWCLVCSFDQFWSFYLSYFSQGYDAQKKAFLDPFWVNQNWNILLAIPSKKMYKILIWKLVKNCIPNIKNRSNFYVFWSIWWCLVCSFWPILKWVFCTFFSRVLPTKLFNFHWLKMDPKKTFFVRHTLGKNKINKSFKIDQKLHTKHHQIDQKTCKFDRFFDVWYVYFDQF